MSDCGSKRGFLVNDVDPVSIQIDVPIDADVPGLATSLDSTKVRVLRPDGTTIEWSLAPVVDNSKKFHVVRRFAAGDLTVQGTYRGRVFAYQGATCLWVSDPFDFPVGPNPIGWPT